MKKKILIPMIAVIALVAILIGVVASQVGVENVGMIVEEKVLGGDLRSKTSTEGDTDFSDRMARRGGTSQEQLDANAAAEKYVLDTTEMFSDKDLEQSVDLTDSVVLDLVSGEDSVISSEGVYVMSGDYTDTMVVIEADDEAKVQLIIDGLTIENSDKPAIYVKSADKVFVTTTASHNSFTVTGSIEADGESNLDAVVFSRSDITFNGVGSLAVTSSDNGISSKDDLKITGGTYTLETVNHSLEANDSVRIYDGIINITSENDAIHSENEEDESLGYVYIKGGHIVITAADDAIRGNSAVVIDGGLINIDYSGEGLEASQITMNDGEVVLYSVDDGINATYKTSYRAMIEINGGNISVTMASGDTDGFDSNGDLTVNGGTINVHGGMAAFDVDGERVFNGGEIYIDGEAVNEIPTQSFGNRGMGSGGN